MRYWMYLKRVRCRFPGPQNGRFAAEPLMGLTSLKDGTGASYQHNGSVSLALAQGDTIARILGEPSVSKPKGMPKAKPKAKVAKK